MLIETIQSLFNLLNSINDYDNVKNICDKVTVLTSEKYRENIALQEKDRNNKIHYPIIVIYDGDMEYDTMRFYNDYVYSEQYTKQYNGHDVYKVDKSLPYMPYNLNYRIEIICKERIHLDTILSWIVQTFPDRGCIDVKYIENGKEYFYNSLTKRGNIIKADERTSSVLYRRTFELKMTTLLDSYVIDTLTLASELKIKEGDNNG